MNFNLARLVAPVLRGQPSKESEQQAAEKRSSSFHAGLCGPSGVLFLQAFSSNESSCTSVLGISLIFKLILASVSASFRELRRT